MSRPPRTSNCGLMKGSLRKPMNQAARPTTIHTPEALAPRGPWSFLRDALPGGFTRWGWGLVGGWCLVVLGPALGWAGHLRRAAGWSALPAHWGEQITLRDLWELWENGGLQHRLTNSPTVHLFGLGLVLVLWCGWRMQAEAAGQKARLGPWLLGALDTLLIGVIPVGIVGLLINLLLRWIGGWGFETLGWISLVARAVLWMACLSTLNVQWWLCRLGRGEGLSRGYGDHLKTSAQRLWHHPVQWGLLAAGGAAVRALLPFLVLLLAWRMGGGTSLRVWLFLVLQLAVTALNAWLLGWLLRVVARFWSHDGPVRAAIRDLEEASRAS